MNCETSKNRYPSYFPKRLQKAWPQILFLEHIFSCIHTENKHNWLESCVNACVSFSTSRAGEFSVSSVQHVNQVISRSLLEGNVKNLFSHWSCSVLSKKLNHQWLTSVIYLLGITCLLKGIWGLLREVFTPVRIRYLTSFIGLSITPAVVSNIWGILTTLCQWAQITQKTVKKLPFLRGCWPFSLSLSPH